MGKRRQFRKQCVSVFGWLERSSTAGEFSNFQNAGRNVYKEVAILWKNKESYVDESGVFGLSIIKQVTLKKIVAHDFRYDPRTYRFSRITQRNIYVFFLTIKRTFSTFRSGLSSVALFPAHFHSFWGRKAEFRAAGNLGFYKRLAKYCRRAGMATSPTSACSV